MEAPCDYASYRLLQLLGSGAAGEVYLATPLEDKPFAKRGAPLAIKVYRPEILRQKNQLTRIEREFQVGSKLRHPNLVKIHDYIPQTDDVRPCLVMEYIDGMRLDEWLTQFHPISSIVLIRLFVQLVDAVEHLHSEGIIHRDLKPANVMMSSDFTLRLMDFGVARVKRDPPITDPDKFLGTIRNAAPELLFGHEVDDRVDLYSLGTVLYSLLHGREVFADEEQFARLITRRENEDPAWDPSLSGNDDIITPQLVEMGKKLLSRNPDQRFRSTEEVAAELQTLLDRLPELPEVEPLHGYMATALTGLSGDARKAILFPSSRIAEVAKQYSLYVYQPRKASDPVLHKDVEPKAVYLLDRKRVITADILLILADKPSFGVGQELEIASSFGIPTLIIADAEASISKMVTGSFANLLDDMILYQSPEDLVEKVGKALCQNLDRIRRDKARLIPIKGINLGSRIEQLRREAGYASVDEFADAVGISRRLIQALEVGDAENIGVLLLQRIAATLRVTTKALFEDELVPASPSLEEDGNLRVLTQVAERFGWTHKDFNLLKLDYRKELAASGRQVQLGANDWVKRHAALVERQLRQELKQKELF